MRHGVKGVHGEDSQGLVECHLAENGSEQSERKEGRVMSGGRPAVVRLGNGPGVCSLRARSSTPSESLSELYVVFHMSFSISLCLRHSVSSLKKMLYPHCVYMCVF